MKDTAEDLAEMFSQDPNYYGVNSEKVVMAQAILVAIQALERIKKLCLDDTMPIIIAEEALEKIRGESK